MTQAAKALAGARASSRRHQGPKRGTCPDASDRAHSKTRTMSTTEVVNPPAPPSAAPLRDASRDPRLAASKLPTVKERLDEVLPLAFFVPVAGPPVILLLGPCSRRRLASNPVQRRAVHRPRCPPSSGRPATRPRTTPARPRATPRRTNGHRVSTTQATFKTGCWSSGGRSVCSLIAAAHADRRSEGRARSGETGTGPR